MMATGRASDPWLRLAAALALVAAWLVLEDYDGITHDATLYSFQALARLHPDALRHDVALRFGSQDDYTLFSAAYAPLIGWFGLDDAALVVSALSLALLASATWVLARRVLGARAALLGVGLVIVLPGNYGAERVFRVFEMFATPRPLAEACVLLGLAICLGRPKRGRAALCVMTLLAGACLHPIIALPGIAVALVYLTLSRLPALDGARGVVVAIAALAVTIALAAAALPRMDDDWFLMVRDRMPYVFVSTWTADDWAVLAPRAAVLVTVARLAAPGDSRTLVRATLWVLAGALLATWLLADWLHVVLAIQLQPWRASWLATLLAALVLPLIVTAADARQRLALPLLGCAWFADSTLLILVFSALAVAAAWLPEADPRRSAIRTQIAAWLPRAAWAAAVMLAVFSLFSVFALPYDMFAEPSVGGVVNRLRMLALAPVVGIAFAWLVHWVGTRSARSGVAGNVSRGVALAAATLSIGCAAPSIWHDWETSRFPATAYARLATWRELIPPKAEVMCVDDARTCWFLLGRASYVSGTQSVQSLFSRDAAMEMRRRARELAPLSDPTTWLSWQPRDDGTPRAGVAAACRRSRVDFIVAENTSLTTAESRLASASEGALRLYRCADLRR